MKVIAQVSMNLVGCSSKEEIEVPDDADETLIEEIVLEWMFEKIEWGWRKTE